MKKIYFIIWIAICLAKPSAAQDFDWLPALVGDHQVTAYQGFTLSYNEDHEQADWVAYELTAQEAASKGKRCECFDDDDNITTGSSSPRDYTSTGFDKGHLAPSADNRMSERP